MTDLMTRKKAHTYEQYHKARETVTDVIGGGLLGALCCFLLLCLMGAAPLP